MTLRAEASMLLTKYEFSETTKQWLKSPTFNNWEWDEQELVGLLALMYEELGLVEQVNINQKCLKSFLGTIRGQYNCTPFHNFKHAFCVTQMCYTILHVSGLVDRLTTLEKLALITACIGHGIIFNLDLDHPGYNNAYQINANTELALIYNDLAPLESHHASMLFSILQHERLNILRTLSDSDRRQVRKLVLKCILSTDMAKHGDIVSQFKKTAATFDFENASHREDLLVMVIKCADISTEVRPPHVAERWVDLLLEEFFSQSDREKQEGLPTMPFMDREKVTKPAAQIGFIQFVMIPLYETLALVLPSIENDLVTPIKKSLQYYKDMQAAATGNANK